MTNLSFAGTITGDPELRFTPSGAAVASFTVAENHREKQGDQWVDAGTTYWKCSAWNAGKLPMAENVASTLRKGDKVLVIGEQRTREYETRDGKKGTSLEVRVEHVGKNARFHGEPQNDAWGENQGGAPF